MEDNLTLHRNGPKLRALTVHGRGMFATQFIPGGQSIINIWGKDRQSLIEEGSY